MDNKVLNKQIPIKTIVDIANYFEEYKERYSDLFQKDQEKNEKLKLTAQTKNVQQIIFIIQ